MPAIPYTHNTLSTAFDVSTRASVKSFSVSDRDNSPQDVAFSNDGAKMFVLGLTNSQIYEYALPAAFDLSDATFVDATLISSQEIFPTGMAFSNDGAKMFVVDNGQDTINEYNLSSVYPITVTGQTASDTTPPTFISSGLDLSTGVLMITFSEAIDVTPPANVVPAKIHIRESGTYTGGTTLSAAELDTAADSTTVSFTLTSSHLTTVKGLTTPELTIEPGAVRDASENLIVGTFDASTAVFVDATSVSSEETDLTGMAFSNDGTKMFVIGFSGDEINEYALSHGL